MQFNQWTWTCVGVYELKYLLLGRPTNLCETLDKRSGTIHSTGEAAALSFTAH